jgi:hypothetical protein
MNVWRLRWILRAFLIGAAVYALPLPSAWAVPSFARQTGMACSTCHTVFPELTPFGREFKLNGYVLDNMKQIKGMTVERTETMALNTIPPLSLMAQISYNHISKGVPDTGGATATPPTLANPGDTGRGGDVNFPQQVSFFYSGKIAEGLGAFMQLTYDGVGDHFGLDNTDIRYAHHFAFESLPDKDLIVGLSLNNNPTVQDPWNTTPAWGYPYAGSAIAPTPSAASQLDGTLAGNVAGLSGYFWYDHSLYGEFGVYTGAKAGGVHPFDSTQTPFVHGVAPYWRLGYEYRWDRNSLSVGTYGLRAGVVPGGLPASAPADKFTDYAGDVQYQYISDDHQLSALANYIHESQSLDASEPGVSDSLNTFKLAANYYYQRKIGASVGFFNTTGSTDAVLYAAAPVSGSANGSPSSRGYVFELNYLPFLNVKLQLQYVAYSKFNGGGGNYDGSGRDASDNNTLYVLGWFNF